MFHNHFHIFGLERKMRLFLSNFETLCNTKFSFKPENFLSVCIYDLKFNKSQPKSDQTSHILFFSDMVNYWNKGFEKLPWKSFKRQKPFWLFATSKTKRQISRKRIRAAFGKVFFCFMTWNDVVDLFCMLMIFLLHCFSSSQIREDAFGKQIKLSTFCFIQFSLVSIPSCFERSEKPAIEKINLHLNLR